MLKNISVDGFKSLAGFEIDFRRGLNVIVGPNGSGKTNVILFLEFVSHLSRAPLLEAVSRVGGAGNIFRKEKNGDIKRTITLGITGESNHQYRTVPKSPNSAHVKYSFEAKILLQKPKNTLMFGEQRFRLAISESQEQLSVRPSDQWDVDIGITIDDQLTPTVTFYQMRESLIVDRYSRQEKIDTSKIKETIVEMCNDYSKSLAIFQFIDRYIPYADAIERDLFNAKSFNVDPNIVRKPEDIAGVVGIQPDGAGLAATLYALKYSDEGASRYHPAFLAARYLFRFERGTGKQVLARILEYSRLVNEAIHDIDVESDPLENKLRIFVDIDYDDGLLRLPFSFVSDGTAKWFTLVAAILTNESIFAIEEPENFLHPLMQREIVRIVRHAHEDQEVDLFAIMTTHSETILNCVSPSELILIQMVDGRTIATRTSNSKDLAEEINRTGFGLGHYYLSGAVE